MPSTDPAAPRKTEQPAMSDDAGVVYLMVMLMRGDPAHIIAGSTTSDQCMTRYDQWFVEARESGESC